MEDSTPGKTCSACAARKPYSEFQKGKGYRDGYTGQCKKCRTQAIIQARKRNPDSVQKAQSRWYASRGTAYYRKWQAENRESVQASSRKWREGNREASRQSANRYRAKAAGAVEGHTLREWLDLLARYDNRCAACGSEGKIERDHIIPLKLGGSDGIENIQPLCHRCNCRKGQKTTDYRRM